MVLQNSPSPGRQPHQGQRHVEAEYDGEYIFYRFESLSVFALLFFGVVREEGEGIGNGIHSAPL